jgi:hypothetical protein
VSEFDGCHGVRDSCSWVHLSTKGTSWSKPSRHGWRSDNVRREESSSQGGGPIAGASCLSRKGACSTTTRRHDSMARESSGGATKPATPLPYERSTTWLGPNLVAVLEIGIASIH